LSVGDVYGVNIPHVLALVNKKLRSMFDFLRSGLMPSYLTRKNKELPDTLTPETAGQSSVNVAEANPDAFQERMKLLIWHFKPQGGIAEIARNSGLSEAVIRSWRDGGSDPSRARCIQLARGTGVSLLWLVAGIGNMFEGAEAESSVAPSHQVSAENLTLALELVDQAIELRDLPMPRSRKAALSMAVAEALQGGMSEAAVIRLLWATS
jgi:transcriptional regulator with XRE-family HTH domain